MDFNNILHVLGMIVTILFIAAVLYSLVKTLRSRQKKHKREKDLETYEHVKIDNVSQFNLNPQNGYYKYPVDVTTYTRRYPQNFTAISLELANDQPYSICLIGFAEYEKGQLKDQHYYYVQPPENNFTKTKDHGITWDQVRKAYEFGEYWNAGMKDFFINHTIVTHNAPFVMGCIAHALKVFGIEAPRFQFIDTLDIAKKLYTFDSNQLEEICQEMSIEIEPHNSLSEAAATAQFFMTAKRDFPTYLPHIHYANGMPTEREILASAIATVEREDATPEEMFAPLDPVPDLLQKLLDSSYIEPGEKDGTYYATDEGLDFSEQSDVMLALGAKVGNSSDVLNFEYKMKGQRVENIEHQIIK